MTKAVCRSLVLVVVLGILAACGTSRADDAQTAVPTAKPTAADSQAQGQVGAKPTAAPKPTAKPRATPKPKPTATPEVEKEKLKVEATGLGQNKKEVAYAFTISNPNTGLAVESTQYQVSIYDEAGKVIKTDSGYLDILFPGQVTGFAGTTYLDSESEVADKIEIQLSEGRYEDAEAIPTFEAEQVAYLPGDYSSRVAGVISSPYNKDVNTLRVAAIAYDDAGKIIGGGYTYLSFVPANGKSALMMSVTTAATPAKVELYAGFSSLSDLGSNAEEKGAKPITITAEGYGQDDNQLGFGMLVKNPNSDLMLEGSQYQVAVYAEDGSVLGVDEGYLGVQFPDSEVGLAGNIYLPDETTASKVVMQVLTGRSEKAKPQDSFTSEDASFEAGDYSSKVTGSVNNPFTKEVKSVRVNAITFDDAGKIIGGGYTYADFIPAGGKSAVEVSVVTAGTPAKAELYATVSDPDDIK
jgi:hypothetical protein